MEYDIFNIFLLENYFAVSIATNVGREEYTIAYTVLTVFQKHQGTLYKYAQS